MESAEFISQEALRACGKGKGMDGNHKKKMVAPVVITIVFLLYLAVYIIGIVMSTNFHPAMILLAIPLVGLGIGMVYILKERIKEIRSGEEDDLSNY